MNIQLIHGNFRAKDALEIITQMIHIKIKFHENKIKSTSNEEDATFSENIIKRLQKELYEVTQYIESKGKRISLESFIEIH